MRAAVLPLIFAVVSLNGAALAADAATPARGIALGGGVFAAPTYEGSDKTRVVGFPVVFPVGLGMGDTVQFEGIDDIRLRLITLNGFEAGGVLGYRFGRNEDDDDRLLGLGDVDGGVVAGAFVGYRTGAVVFDAAYGHELTGADTGGVLRLGAKADLAMSPAIKLTARLGTAWADADFQQAFFGVTAVQSASSGYAIYTPDAGFKDVHLALSSEIAVTDRWTLRAFGKVAQLIGDAAESPLVQSETQVSGGAIVSYRIDWGQ